jgi:uncharacterized protein (TIGR02246 family)
MTREEIFALFSRRETAWQARDAAALTADHSPSGVVVSPTGGVLEGRTEIERIYRVWFTAFPDLIFTTEDLLVDENRIALLCRITGSHAGEFFGMPPTGRRIEVSGAFIYRGASSISRGCWFRLGCCARSPPARTYRCRCSVFRDSSSSSVRGQSSFNKRESARSESKRPPVWHCAQ